MKLFLTLLVVSLFCQNNWAQSGSDIPPPPMPDYMKKHRITNPPPAPQPKAKLQPQETLQDTPVKEKKTKFLEEASNLKVFSKTEAEITPAQENFLQSLSGENSREVAQEPTDLENENSSTNEEPLEFTELEEATHEQIEEVSEVDVSEPEFEQAKMGDESMENIKEAFLSDAGNTPTVLDGEKQQEEPSENLAEVEQTLEAAEAKAEEQLREPTTTFKPGMHQFHKKCMMRAEPSEHSESQGAIQSGRKLWIDAHNSKWHKAYKKSGAVYISADCLQ